MAAFELDRFPPKTAIIGKPVFRFESDHEIDTELPIVTMIIPVYNERQTVEDVLSRVVKEVTPKDIVIVDDGSTDGSAHLLERWCESSRVCSLGSHIRRISLMRHTTNRGKGAAIRTAIEVARSGFVVVQDADLEVSPDELPKLLKPLLAGEADIVVGYRSHEILVNRSAFRAGIHFLNLLVRLLYGVRLRDEACCFKVLHLRELKRMALECQRFEFCPEVVSKAARLGLRFAEVPITYAPRASAKGKKLRLRDGFQAIKTLWKYRRWSEAGTDNASS